MKTIGIFLITAAFVVGMVGCGPFLLQYNLTISSTEGGEVTTPGEGTFTYFAGTVVGLVVEAEEGYYFVNWTGNIATISCQCRSTTITMNGDYSITAEFEEILPVQYTLSVNSTDGGVVTDPGEGTFTYDCGTLVNLVAVADEGYWIIEWTGDVGTIANVEAVATKITMNSDYEITANFGSVYGDYSGILENVLTSQGDIELFPGVNVTPSEGEHSPVEYYADPWPTPEELENFYWQQVKDETPYPSGTIDLNGVDMDLGPLYRDGTLEILNSSNTPVTLTLTGTTYITGDIVIGTVGKDMTLDLNGHTIFVASDSVNPQKALEIGGKCTIVGPGVIIAVGDIYFAPKILPGMTDPIFLMSVLGENQLQPLGDFYGAVAGSIVVDLQPNTSINYPDNEGWYDEFNFPISI